MKIIHLFFFFYLALQPSFPEHTTQNYAGKVMILQSICYLQEAPTLGGPVAYMALSEIEVGKARGICYIA